MDGQSKRGRRTMRLLSDDLKSFAKAHRRLLLMPNEGQMQNHGDRRSVVIPLFVVAIIVSCCLWDGSQKCFFSNQGSSASNYIMQEAAPQDALTAKTMKLKRIGDVTRWDVCESESASTFLIEKDAKFCNVLKKAVSGFCV